MPRRGSRLQRLVLTPKGIRPLTDARVGSGHTIIVPSGDGEFVAGCDRCDWLSFGSYTNPRARQIRDACEDHARQAHPEERS